MKLLIKLTLALIIYASCATVKPTPLYNEKCPFRRLNFTTSTEKDTLLRTLSINDTLVAALQADLKELKQNGKVGNNLTLAVNRVSGMSRTSGLDVTNEYYQLFNNKTTALCGLNDLLRDNKSLRNQESRNKAEALLLQLTEDLSNFSDKKKQQMTQ
jgi:hypothetical protein